MITGAMKTTASTVLNVLSDLLPIHLAVDKWRHNAALSLATIPKDHPLHAIARRAARRYVKKHPSPLHELFHTYDIKPDMMEKIIPIRHPSTWNPGIKTVIPDSKDAAIEQCDKDKAEYQLYTDGSLTKDGVGAAAVVYKNDKRIALTQFHLGPATEHTVYEAECAAMALGVYSIKGKQNVKSVTINVDNQAAIIASTDRKQGPGKYILDIFHEQVNALRRRNNNMRLKIRWSPGHV